MRIGIDLRPLQNNNKYRGIGKYTEYLLIALSKIRGDHKFVFYVDNTLEKPLDILSRFPGHTTKTVRPNYLAKVRYIRAFAKPNNPVSPYANDVDVLLQTDPWGGIPRSVPTVAIFHDLIPFLFQVDDHLVLKGISKLKHSLAKHVSKRNYLAMLRSYADAAQIVAVSECSKRDYLKHIDSSPSPDIKVVLEALIGGVKTVKANNTTYERLKLKGVNYLIYVGGIDLRKNVIQLLYDLKVVRENYRDVKLVLVGKEFGLKNDLKRLGWFDYLNANPELKDAVIYAGYVEQTDMPAMLQNASVFVLPSKYEGFGLPILEAMDAGCPVVCYNNSSIPEVAGDATIMIQDGEPMAPHIMKLLTNDRLRKDLISKGTKQLSKFSWDRSSSQILDIMKDLT